MIYNSFNFLILFPLIFWGYYVIPAKYQRLRNMFLLVVSYLLYINFTPVYALVLLGVTIATYLGGAALDGRWKKDDVRTKKEDDRCASSVVKRRLVWVFGILGLLPLLFFKYFDFINEGVYDVLSIAGLRYELQGLNWAIPVGISFYTFQALGYLFDVYYRRISAENDFLTYALFISFFPSIVAGPINKASLIIPQLKALRPYFDYAKAVEGLKLLLWGMFMKVVVADRFGLYVDTILPNYTHYTGFTCLVASIFYTIQIYADFAGYSLMAIGVGKTLGFDLTENFRRPYFAVSVTDFWRRWHISLSTWLKDYVYIPLGGSRCSKIRNYWNIFVTFLVSGIWHGANWTFVIWGMMHGVFQVIEKAMGQQKCKYGWFGKTIKIFITFILVNFAWIFFRMPTLSEAWGVFTRILNGIQSFSLYIDVNTFLYAAFGFIILFIKDFKDEYYAGRILLLHNKNMYIRWVSYLGLTALILLSGVFGADQFIYANF